jgi:hypothetical protein
VFAEDVSLVFILFQMTVDGELQHSQLLHLMHAALSKTKVT